jgi:Multiubiquitin
MEQNNIEKEIVAIENVIASDAREIAELSQELVDLEAYAHSGKPIPDARRYKIKIDGEYHLVETASISGAEILRLARRTGPLVFIVIQHFRHGVEEVIPPDARVDLRKPGVERFTTQPRIVRITLDNKPLDIQAGTYVVSELKACLGVPQAKALDLVVDGEFRELPDHEKINIRGGEVFVSHVRHGRSS